MGLSEKSKISPNGDLETADELVFGKVSEKKVHHCRFAFHLQRIRVGCFSLFSKNNKKTGCFCRRCWLGFDRYCYRLTPSFLFPTGRQLIVENYLVKDTLCLVQNEVRELIDDYKSMELKLSDTAVLQAKVLEDVATLKDQDACHEKRLYQHTEQLDALEEKLIEVSEIGSEEIKNVLGTLLSIEEKLSMRLQVVEEGLAHTYDRVEQLEQNQDLLHHRCDKADDKVGQIEEELTKLKEETSKPGMLR